jgi:hypothetical protein
MAAKVFFERIGIKAPGRINLKLDGRFQTVALDDLSQDKLKQLYDNGCNYVGLTSEGRKKYFPDEKPITTKKISFE